MLVGEEKTALIKDSAIHKTDTGSSAVQVTLLTKQINEVTTHLKTNKHDFMARRGLLQMVGKRRRLLRYLAKNDPKVYLSLVKKLGLRH